MKNYKVDRRFPMYRIYNDGRIQNIAPTFYNAYRGKQVSNPYFMKFKSVRKHPTFGHLFCSISGRYEKNRTVHIHKIVAELFVPNPKKKLHVIHKDGNKKNNHFTNLQWVSQGDLNYAQYKSGNRDPIKEAANMRKNGGIRDWTKAETKCLVNLRDKKKMDWKMIGRRMKGRTLGTIQVKYSNLKSKQKL